MYIDLSYSERIRLCCEEWVKATLSTGDLPIEEMDALLDKYGIHSSDFSNYCEVVNKEKREK